MAIPFKTIIILIVSCLGLTYVSAQKNNSFVGIRLGGALPMGEMASHEFGYGGYALLGRNIGAEAAWFVTPKLGLGIDISSNSCGFAAVYYAEDYRESEPSFDKVDMLSGPYKIVTYMGGVYYKVEISPKISSTFKLMGGLFKARTPDQFYGVDAFGGIKLTFWKTAAYDTRFSFLTGAAFEYHVYDHVSILLQADFTYAQMAFSYSSPSGATSYTDHLHMPVFRLSPGININF